MKYTKDQRLDIGRRIYEGEISRFEAATEYGIGSNLRGDEQGGTDSGIGSSQDRGSTAKKGYEVKGAGAQKEFAPLDSKSTK